ncbi:MAG: tetratricopeptide repeat protein [Gemmataceae bacterium]
MGLVDHRTDVYSLGATLYELLTLRPAVPGTDRQEMLKSIAFEEPVRPRKIDAAVPVDLETVVLKAMAKNPRERYATARELADDLRRVLEDQPVKAKRPGLLRRVGKLARRHKAVVATAAAGLVLAVAALAASAGWAVGERRARQAQTAQAVEAALQEARDWIGKDRPYEALSATLRAEGFWKQGGEQPELRRPVEGMLRDIRLLLRLELARLSGTAVRDGNFDSAVEDQEYEKGFQEDGLDVFALDTQEAVGHILGRAIVAELSAHLDHWALVRKRARGQGDPGWQNLLAVARGVEPAEGRERVRQLLLQKDRKTLVQLLREGQLDSIPAFLKCDMVALLQDDPEAAEGIALIRRDQQRRPDDFWLNHSMGVALRRSRPSRLEEAAGFYRSAVALRPQSPGANLNLGASLLDLGKADEAIACFSEAVRLQPDYANAHSGLGAALMDVGRMEEAISSCREAIRLQPEDANGHYNLGNALRAKGRLDDAIVEWRQAIRLNPDNAEAHGNLGAALWMKGRLDDAIAECRQAIRLKPDLAEAHASLGTALYALGKPAEAIAEYRRAIQLKPDVGFARRNLGLLTWRRQEAGRGGRRPARAVRLSRDDAARHTPTLAKVWRRRANSLRLLSCSERGMRWEAGPRAGNTLLATGCGMPSGWSPLRPS